MRRRIKAVLSGTATDNDVRNVSQNLDSIIQVASEVSNDGGSRGGSIELSPSSAAPPPSNENSFNNSLGMPIKFRNNNNSTMAPSPGISPNTSMFFNEADSILSPSSQSILRSQQLYSSTNLAGSNPRHVHRSATMYQSGSRRPSAVSVGAGPGGASRSRSTSLSSPMNSPALQFLTRFASQSFSPSGDPFARGDGATGEEVGGYIIGKMIGYGGFSEVKEAHTLENDEKKTLAVKIVYKVAANIPVRNPEVMTQDALDQVQSEFLHEVTLWKTLDHPNILKLLSFHEDEKAMYCFTSKISGGTLFDLVKKSKHEGLKPRTAVNYIRQIANALLYLHETMHIVHRDVKPENCLIEEEEDGGEQQGKTPRVVLCDFGMSDYFHAQETDSGMLVDEDPLSQEPLADDNDEEDARDYHWPRIGPSGTSSLLNQHHATFQKRAPASGTTSRRTSRQNSLLTESQTAGSASASGSPAGTSASGGASDNNFGSLPYAAPEVLDSKTPIFLPTVDMWALGVLMYTMLAGRLPWHHAFAPRLRQMICEAKIDWDALAQHVYEQAQKDGELDKQAERAARQIVEGVKGCLEVEAERRWTIRQVVEHEWGYPV